MKIHHRCVILCFAVLSCLVFLGFINLYTSSPRNDTSTSSHFPSPELNLIDMFKNNWNKTYKKSFGIETGNVEILERTRSALRDLSKYIRSESRRIQQLPEDSPKVDSILRRLNKFSGEFVNYLEMNIETLEVKNDLLVQRQVQLQNITRRIQKKIFNLQNDPSNCVSGKVLLCELTVPAGFASGIHDALSCFVEAYYAGKIVVLDITKWHYTLDRDWSSVGFRPLSDTCEEGNFKRSDETLRLSDNTDKDRGKLMHLPNEVKYELLEIGVEPLAWWWGQFVGYILRPNENLLKVIEDAKERLHFNKPIVGIHIRRTDKVQKEARFHGNEVYMQEVERYYDKLNIRREVARRNVYLATDDSSAFKDLKRRYPEYNFIFQERISSLAENKKTRYNNESLYGLLIDLYLLADSDYLVCTMSSGFCRLAFELSNYLKTTSQDISQIDLHPSAYSLDVPLHYTYVLPPKRVVILDHLEEELDQLTARTGDVLEITDDWYFEHEARKGKLEDGFSVWKNARTGKVGRIPNFKTKELYEGS